MASNQTTIESVVGSGRPVRPVLILSQRMTREYSVFLQHILVGLADESIKAMLVCPPRANVEFVSGLAELVRYPAIELPLMEHFNQRILASQIAQFEPTVLHCLCEQRSAVTARLARWLDVPYVLSINSLQRGAVRFPISTRRLSAVIVPARSVAEHITSDYPRLAARVRQVNMGTFVGEKPICFSHGRLPCVLTAGNLDKSEPFEKLLEAAKDLTVEGHNFMLVIMGQGRQEGKLRKRIAELGLQDSVTLVPWLERWQSVLAGGDIFVQVQAGDSFSPLLMEAMSLGTAVVACRGGVDDLVLDGQTCAVFEADDRLSLKRTLGQLLGRPDYARQLATAAQEYLRSHHTVSTMIGELLAVYRQATDRSATIQSANQAGRSPSVTA